MEFLGRKSTRKSKQLAKILKVFEDIIFII